MTDRTCVDCGRIYPAGTGNGTLCARDYARMKRGGPKRKEPVEKRTRNFQVALTEALHFAITQAVPDPVQRAEWARRMLREGLEVLLVKLRLGAR